MLSSCVKIRSSRRKAHLVFHWCLYNKSFFFPGKPCNSPGLRVICFIPDTGNKKQITPQSQELSFINILKKNVNKERRRMMSKLIAKKFGTLFRVYCLYLNHIFSMSTGDLVETSQQERQGFSQMMAVS